jgi:hypothetical protein
MSISSEPDGTVEKVENDPLLLLRGSGKDLWSDEHADEYVRRLCDGWSEPGDRLAKRTG